MIGWKLVFALVAGSSVLTTIGIFLLARLTNVFDAYASERGKLLAQFHNLDRLVEQTEALTATTETIKSRISDEVWDRQKRWEAKQKAYVELLIALDDVISAEIAHRTHWNAVDAASDDLELRSRHLEESRKSVEQKSQALRNLSRALFTASITTAKPCVALLNELSPILGRTAERTLERTGTDEDLNALYGILNRLQVVARDDLKVEFPNT